MTGEQGEPGFVHDHGERWDVSDRNALRMFVEEGRTSREIAVLMGRTWHAIRHARRRYL